MIKSREILIYLCSINLSLIAAYFISYRNSLIFEVNFTVLNMSKLEILFIYNALSILIYFILNYLFKFESIYIQYGVTFIFQQLVVLLSMWAIKFVNLSRVFTISYLLIFYIVLVILSRFRSVEKEKLFITFDNDLSKDYPGMLIIDSENFPKDFLDIASKSMKRYALRGFVYKQSKPLRYNFENIIEISNFLGIDIYEEHEKKFKLVHKSTSINKPLKNLEDIILLILLGIPFAFIIFVVSIIILIFQGRPIFYKQIRVGENGKYFHIYKFRSMIDKNLTENQLERLNERSKIVFKSRNDPRITKLGKFLRKSSIDELPQIINIFKNEMSFIGPRPPITKEVEQYELRHLKRISIKPGITGLWQVTLRQDNDFEKWVKKDIEYIDNWSLIKDIKILYLTIFEITKLSGE